MVMPKRPTRYYVEYTDRLLWEKLHRVPGEPADQDDFRLYLEVKTLRAGQRESERLLEKWPFAQPQIYRRTVITPVAWNYSSEPVSDDDEQEGNDE